MGIIDLFSKRQKRLGGDVPEIFQYDDIPQKLRVQIIHIIKDAVGENDPVYNNVKSFYYSINNSLCREYGQFKLLNETYGTVEEYIFNFFLFTKDVSQALDVIELTFMGIRNVIGNNINSYRNRVERILEPEEAIQELNERFKEHGIGYSFDGNQIIRVDSTFIHAEITKPTISLLWNQKFSGPNEEYLKAHEHYRNGRNKECLNECLKAFESTIKVIGKEKKWKVDQKATSKLLISACLENDLIPIYLRNQFSGWQSLLESGVGTIRNKLGGHGQGNEITQVSNEMARYALNLTGANIIFLIEQSGIK